MSLGLKSQADFATGARSELNENDSSDKALISITFAKNRIVFFFLVELFISTN